MSYGSIKFVESLVKPHQLLPHVPCVLSFAREQGENRCCTCDTVGVWEDMHCGGGGGVSTVRD